MISMDFWGLVISSIMALILLIYLSKQKNKSQLQNIFMVDAILVFFWDIGILLQNQLSSKYNINPYVFEYFVYIFACLLPVAIFFTGLIFANTKIKFKKSYLLLFIVPIISLIMVWTNDYHHLFYVNYSVDLNNTVYGPYFNIYSIYNLILYAIGLIYLLRYSIKNSGFFSKQAILFTIATLIPLVANILGTFDIIDISVSMTPILFTVTILLCALAIFKFDFLKVTPIALQRIVDRMSDGYLVLNEKNMIIDFNKTFLQMFHTKDTSIRNQNFMELLNKNKLFDIDLNDIKEAIDKARNSDKTFHFEKKLDNEEKYFNIEINSIHNDKSFLGTLILFKDTTQHMLDMQTIQNNQNMLMERERLASLGQLIGGIAHNLKTPIMSIAGAAEGLTDLIKEYEASVRRPRSYC